ncbi:ISL3 family transposase [Cesiribacter sp. SM1]|uniref:ISL3 family transposase n=1 Tax=Cesiribacter sp. SM1 TaxID=2861196 RepID=UPI001CD53852|nr:ISL3 family transposase [Cesiribacter sp. SM1]
METSLLIPPEFEVLATSVTEAKVTLQLQFTAPGAYCPLCNSLSTRIHSCYERKLQDLPISGKVVELRLCTRKFFCQQQGCPRKIFAQQQESCLKRYGRRLLRVGEQVICIGCEMGAKPGARICRLIGLPLSASTVLRNIKGCPTSEPDTPSILGVDDFAFRKRETYVTILVDLEKRKPIDLLPDREGKTLEAWLLAHPGIAIVSRDRSSVYAHAITRACPDAVQVADRWHLLKNLGENTTQFLDRQRSLIRETAQEVFEQAKPEAAAELPEKATGVRVEKRYALYEKVKQLQSEHYSIKAIARHLGISRNTVKKYFLLETFVPKCHPRLTNLLAHEAYLRQRWQEGQQCAKTLLQEIKERGYNGSYTILAGFLSNYPKKGDAFSLPPARKVENYSTRSLSIAFCKTEQEWEGKQKPFLTKLLEKSSLLKQLWELNLEFKSMMAQKKGDNLQAWCEKAVQHAPFKSFVQGIRQDFDAVYQAMSSSWSNGQTEGQVNRLKNIKRQMYGRASFGLLRLRVLANSA